MFRFTLVFVALLTAGCVSLDPNYERPAAPVPATLPGSHGEATAVVSDWQQVVNDARLKKVVNIALTSNRDVQKALADIGARAGSRLVLSKGQSLIRPMIVVVSAVMSAKLLYDSHGQEILRWLGMN